MDDILGFTDDCYESVRWYHERSDERRLFDQIVMDELARGIKIAKAVKTAVRQIPGMGAVVAEQTIPELKDYYSKLQNLELEIATVNSMKAHIRKRKIKKMLEAEALILGAEKRYCQRK